MTTPAGRARIVLLGLGAILLGCLVLMKAPWTVVVDPAKGWRIPQYVAVYLWAGLAIDLFLVLMLAGTAHWWARPAAPASLPSRVRAPKWFWPAVVIAMVVDGGLCWPRLGQSFWHDESYPIRNAIVGFYKKKSDGSLRLRPATWAETLFFYKKPNHTLYSAMARVANDSWRAIAKPKGLPFNESVIRVPAYLAGIASIGAMALLLEHLEFSSAGALAAFLTALHPWHIRYSSEARAYAFVLMLLPLVTYCLLRAIEEGRWRWWAAQAAGQFLLIYSYPACAYVLAVLNLCVPLALWWQHGSTPGAFTQWLRWLASSAFAAMLFIPLILPCVPQFLEYVKGTPGQGQLTFGWVANFLAHMLAGIPWAYRGHYEANSIEMYPWFVAHPGLGVLIVFLALSFLAMGIRRMIAKGRVPALLPVIFLLPAALCYAETKVRGGFVYEWYLIFLLPGALALVALGMDELAALARTRVARVAAGALIVGIVLAYAAWTAPQRAFLRRQAIQPNRESVALCRPNLDPDDPRQRNIITATFYGPPEPYDPHIVIFRSAQQLGDLVREADASNKALFINLGYLTTVEGEHPAKYEFLKTSGMFEEVALLAGFEPTMQSRHVFKYIPGSAAGFDFNSLPADRGRPGAGYSY